MKAWKSLTVLAIVAAAGWCILAGPVLLRLSLGPFLRDHFVIFNPIRNRNPERLARHLLTQIHSPSCMQTLGSEADFQGKREAICEKQAADPLRNECRLFDRVDFRSEVGVLFECGYQHGAPDGAFVTLTFLSRGKNLTIEKYERLY